MPDGSMLIVSMAERAVLRWRAGHEPTLHADISSCCGHWANDMVIAEMAFPNGMAPTTDGTTIIVTATMTMRLTAFGIAGVGRLSNRRTFAGLAGVVPDGICLDEAGHVWAATAIARQAVRIAEGGEISAIVPTPQRCCARALGAKTVARSVS
jgi:sugar lactone lactonase YvrE